MTGVLLSIDREDVFRVTVRPDLRPERGGTAFVDVGQVSFLLDVDRLAELRDAMTAAIERPVTEG